MRSVTRILAPAGPHAITLAHVGRLQLYLRRLLRCPDLWIEDADKRDGSVQLRIGHEVVGTIDEVHEEGERYWAVTLIVLLEKISFVGLRPTPKPERVGSTSADCKCLLAGR